VDDMKWKFIKVEMLYILEISRKQVKNTGTIGKTSQIRKQKAIIEGI